MAATGKTPILLYGSTTATNQPSAGNLTNSSDGCEIAINVADKNLFFKDSTNTVNTVPIRQSSASSDGWLSSTDWSTFNNKQPAGSYALTSGTLAQFASTTSAQLAGVISDETGTGSLVFGTSPTFTTSATLSDSIATPVIYSIRNDNAGTSAGVKLSLKYSTTEVALLSNQFDGATFNTKLWNTTSGYISLGTSNTERVKIVDSGDVTVSTGNLVIGTSGNGIDFSATAGTGTSELLADYEEGTWTPSQGAGLTVVGSFSSSGTYTKVGRQVTIVGIISGSTSVAVSAGGEFTSSLPYAPANAVSGGAVNSNADKGSQLYVGTTIYSINAIAASTSFRFSATYFV